MISFSISKLAALNKLPAFYLLKNNEMIFGKKIIQPTIKVIIAENKTAAPPRFGVPRTAFCKREKYS
jgi:histidine ammonia-lyase